jgi:hypothetical protein
MALQEGLEADLENVGLPSVQGLDAIGVDVDPDYVMAELGHSSRVGGTHIVRANNAHLQCHPQILP